MLNVQLICIARIPSIQSQAAMSLMVMTGIIMAVGIFLHSEAAAAWLLVGDRCSMPVLFGEADGDKAAVLEPF